MTVAEEQPLQDGGSAPGNEVSGASQGAAPQGGDSAAAAASQGKADHASGPAAAPDDSAADNPKAPLDLFQIVGSVLAAGLGVQSSRNRERDFQQGRAVVFIIAGLVFTALFIGGVYTVVSVVLASR